MKKKTEKNLTLTRAELCQIRGLKAQERLAQIDYQAKIAGISADMAAVRESIEARLKLKSGSLATEYSVDLDGGVLVA